MQTELKASRTANGRLVKQVKSLKSVARIHLPSLVVGAVIGAVAYKLLGRFLPSKSKSEEAAGEEGEEVAQNS